jgi:large subunit ribosomal protein L10
MLEKVNASLDNSKGMFVVDYRGLTVKQAQELRRSLREAGAEMKVYKNNIVRIALQEHDMPNLDDVLAGTTAFVFYENDPVAAAKVIKETNAKLKKVNFLGGISDGQAINADQAQAIADLPSREELLARLAAAVAAPLTGIARVCNGPAQGLVTALHGVLDQKDAA